MRKIYVVSGCLRVVIMATNPLEACVMALTRYGRGKVIDQCFYLDERGFREGADAQFRVDSRNVLQQAGYQFEDDGK